MEIVLTEIQNAANTIASPNWAAILSAVAAICSAIAALGAIIVAIIVARKQNEITGEQVKLSQKQADISDKQNKIALFEKRYLVYDELSRIIDVARMVEEIDGVIIKIILATISMVLGYNAVEDFAEPGATVVIEIQRTRLLIKQAPFLFPEVDKKDIDILWTKFQQFYLELTLEVAKNPSLIANQFLPISKFEFIAASKSISEKYLDLMAKRLYFNEVFELCPSPNPTMKTPSSSFSKSD